ncbi:MAG: hypothetical protein NVSMB55_12960 [Mycobacteriales bacterium]
MIGRVVGALAAVMTLSVGLVGGAAGGAGSGYPADLLPAGAGGPLPSGLIPSGLFPGGLLSGGSPPVAYAGGSDDAQVAALSPVERARTLAAARRYVLPPALLAALAPADPAATARALLAGGALPGGAWDARLALLRSGHQNADAVLARAARYGYRYSPTSPPLDPSRYVFPLRGTVSYGPYHHDYPATDIFARIGTPVLACVRSEVLRLSRTDTGKGGLSLTLRGEDGWRYYYAHLSAVVASLSPGDVVEPGQLLGLSGDTGDAHGTDPHLHFGITRTGNAQGHISPYPYLQAWPRG